jgi:hypothetical protein
MRITMRHADTMISVESRSAAIGFEDILEATCVVADDDNGAPWDNRDGFEHTATRANDTGQQGSVYCNNRRERLLIELPADDYGIYAYQRGRGASKQVAYEAVAVARRRTLAQLVEWYRNGWQYYGVVCDYNVLGVDFGSSVWGVDDWDYAHDFVRKEIALEVADQLEAAGYTVTGQPDYSAGCSRDTKQARLARNLASQNWSL